MTPYLFSVVIPTYNRANLVVAALDSVAAQSYRPIELIVSDDGSTDNTGDVLDAWCAAHQEDHDLRIKIVRGENGGAGAARNRGVAIASGEYVQFLDSDDLLHPDRLRRLAEAFESQGADFIQTGFTRVEFDSGRLIETRYAREGADQVALAAQGFLWANSVRSAFRRELINRVGPWPEDMRCFEDRYFVERAVLLAKAPIALKDALVTVRRGAAGTVSSIEKTRVGRTCRIRCEEQLGELLLARGDIESSALEAFASRIYGLGIRTYASGWSDLACRCRVLAERVPCNLSRKGKGRRMVLRAGRFAAMLHGRLGKVKLALARGFKR